MNLSLSIINEYIIRISHTFHSSCDILGLNCNSYTEKDVKTKCRKLSKEWHPDRFRDEKEKANAQEKFMQIQQACSKISQRRKSKERKNKKDSDTFT